MPPAVSLNEGVWVSVYNCLGSAFTSAGGDTWLTGLGTVLVVMEGGRGGDGVTEVEVKVEATGAVDGVGSTSDDGVWLAILPWD